MDATWETAAKEGDASSLAAVITAGADVDALDHHGQSALMRAATGGHLAAVHVLVEAGADLDVTAKYGLSATMLAVVNRHGEVAEVLAEAGADLGLVGSGAPGFVGKTAADLAGESGQAELAARLSAGDETA